MNPNNSSDKKVIDGTVSVNVGVVDVAYKSCIRPIVISPGLVFGENYVINGGTAYPTALTAPIYQSDTVGRNVYLDTIRQGAAVYGVPFRADNYDYQRGQGAALLQMFLSTINVLPEAKQKTASQTMRCEYTLTEQT